MPSTLCFVVQTYLHRRVIVFALRACLGIRVVTGGADLAIVTRTSQLGEVVPLVEQKAALLDIRWPGRRRRWRRRRARRRDARGGARGRAQVSCGRDGGYGDDSLAVVVCAKQGEGTTRDATLR